LELSRSCIWAALLVGWAIQRVLVYSYRGSEAHTAQRALLSPIALHHVTPPDRAPLSFDRSPRS
jgi:hypothetical protein